MKRRAKFVVFSTLISQLCFIQISHASSPLTCDADALKPIYQELFESDQAVRFDLFAKLTILQEEAKNKGTQVNDADQNVLFEKMRAIDAENQTALERIVSKCGWPKSAEINKFVVKVAAIILIHADSEYKMKFRPYIEESHLNDDITGEIYALFIDKLMVQQDKSQIYGTQYNGIGGKQLMPIDDPVNVNERRQTIGMPPLGAFPLPKSYDMTIHPIEGQATKETGNPTSVSTGSTE
jgi:hypothetical protein